MAWNFGDILDTIIPELAPDHPALVHGERVLTWADVDRRSNNLGGYLLSHGIATGDKVGFYMRNRPEYMETLAACFRARLTHVNVNYRYQPDEVHYIFDNSDATVVVYGEEFRDNILALRERLPKVKVWVEVGDVGDVPDGIHSYESLVNQGEGQNLEVQRSGDDLLFLYTGGTTGMPKGVMWSHHNLREAQTLSLRAMGEVPETLEELRESVREKGSGEVMIPVCPLMHGTGLFTAMGAFFSGGTVVTLTSPSLDTAEVWAEVERNKVNMISIVGDAFAKPLLGELQANQGRYDLTSLRSIISSGVMWSMEVKQALLEHMPTTLLADSFGSSEAVGFGASITAKDAPIETARFTTNDYCKVFDENDVEIPRGSETPGFIAFGGPIPVGYYGDPEKSAKTFKLINGTRYSIPGDFCLVAEDGTLTLLGRGSVCINSAGEKIYPEEVEEALKLHPSVDDALVVGVPDEKWGQAVTGVIKLQPGHQFDETLLIDFVKGELAHYKAPKHIFVGGPPFRAPNGKADYKSITSFAKEQVAALAQ